MTPMQAGRPSSSPVLVTGATGFIGSQLCSFLADQGRPVHALVYEKNSVHDPDKKIMVHQADITDHANVAALIDSIKPKVIFHLAAYGTFGHEKDVQRMIDVNIAGTIHLLAACINANCRSFIHTGSIKEYPTGRIAVTEDTRLSPWDDYAVTKAAASAFCRLFAQRHNLLVTTLRLSPVYGPGDTPSRFVLTAIQAALAKTPFTLSAGSLVRNFTYIDDVVAALLKAAERATPGYEEFNIGGERAYSFSDIVNEIETATGKKINTTMSSPSSANDDSWVVDISKAKRVLQWEPGVSLKQGIQQTVAWYQAQSYATKENNE